MHRQLSTKPRKICNKLKLEISRACTPHSVSSSKIWPWLKTWTLEWGVGQITRPFLQSQVATINSPFRCNRWDTPWMQTTTTWDLMMSNSQWKMNLILKHTRQIQSFLRWNSLDRDSKLMRPCWDKIEIKQHTWITTPTCNSSQLLRWAIPILSSPLIKTWIPLTRPSLKLSSICKISKAKNRCLFTTTELFRSPPRLM